MQPLELRRTHLFEAMVARLFVSHCRLMDPKSYLGQVTIPFEFGMQAQVSRYPHPIMAMISPWHSYLRNPKSRVSDANIGVQMLAPLQGHNSFILSTTFSPDGSKIISASSEETIRVWDASTGVEMLPPLRLVDGSGTAFIMDAAFSPDGSKIILGYSHSIIRIWDTSTGIEMLPCLQGHRHWVMSVAFSPDESKIVSGSSDKTIRVWNASTGVEVLPPLQGHGDDVHSVVFSPDGSKIVSGSSDRTIRVWNASTGVECSHPFKVMTQFFALHSRLMDLKSSQGRWTRLFKFGMEVLVLRCFPPFDITTLPPRFIPSHSRPMDPKSSRFHKTRRVKSGMQALALCYCVN